MDDGERVGAKRQRSNPTKKRTATKPATKSKAVVSAIRDGPKAVPRWVWGLPLAGLPKSHTARLRYCEEFTIDSGITLPVSYVFRANDLYDPNYSGTGHQPSGFDQLMQWYNHFTVIASKIKVRHAPRTGSNLTPAYFDVSLSDTNSLLFSTATELLESRYASGSMYQVGTERNYVGFNPFIVRRFDANKFFGIRDVTGLSQYRGDAATSPTEVAWWHVWVAPIYGNNPDPMYFLAEIEYIAVFTEPKNIAQS